MNRRQPAVTAVPVFLSTERTIDRELNGPTMSDDVKRERIFATSLPILKGNTNFPLRRGITHPRSCFCLLKSENGEMREEKAKKRRDFRGSIHFPSLTVPRFTRADLGIVKAIAKYPFPTFLIDCLAPATEAMDYCHANVPQIRFAQPCVEQPRQKAGYHGERRQVTKNYREINRDPMERFAV